MGNTYRFHAIASSPYLTFSMIYAGFLMLARVIAVTSCVTFAAGLAARQGPTPMAAFQICLQVWLTSSLLADGLAVSGQVGTALLSSFFHLASY